MRSRWLVGAGLSLLRGCTAIYFEDGVRAREPLKQKPPAALGSIRFTPCEEKNGHSLPTYWLCVKCSRRCETEPEMESHLQLCEAPTPLRPANVSQDYLEEFFEKAADAGLYQNLGESESSSQETKSGRVLGEGWSGTEAAQLPPEPEGIIGAWERYVGNNDDDERSKGEEAGKSSAMIWPSDEDEQEEHDDWFRQRIPFTVDGTNDVYANARIHDIEEVPESSDEVAAAATTTDGEGPDAVKSAHGGGKERKAKFDRYAKGRDLFAALHKAQNGARGKTEASAATGGGGLQDDDMYELSVPSSSAVSTWSSSQRLSSDPQVRIARRFGREMPDDES